MERNNLYLLGTSGSGKTTLLNRFLDQDFIPSNLTSAPEIVVNSVVGNKEGISARVYETSPGSMISFVTDYANVTKNDLITFCKNPSCSKIELEAPVPLFKSFGNRVSIHLIPSLMDRTAEYWSDMLNEMSKNEGKARAASMMLYLVAGDKKEMNKRVLQDLQESLKSKNLSMSDNCYFVLTKMDLFSDQEDETTDRHLNSETKRVIRAIWEELENIQLGDVFDYPITSKRVLEVNPVIKSVLYGMYPMIPSSLKTKNYLSKEPLLHMERQTEWLYGLSPYKDLKERIMESGTIEERDLLHSGLLALIETIHKDFKH